MIETKPIRTRILDIAIGAALVMAAIGTTILAVLITAWALE